CMPQRMGIVFTRLKNDQTKYGGGNRFYAQEESRCKRG
ncbi:unnamed protein product, partial [Allacma fusca]